MNNKRREKLYHAERLLDSAASDIRETVAKAKNTLNEAESYISDAEDEKEDCLNNMPGNLEMSERYEKMEGAVDALEDALSDIDSTKENIENAAQ